jgi:CO dehydrogenase nickel-insertion accessory protein CooC1
MRDIPATLEKARAEIAGKASGMLLDVDLTTLDHLATQGNLPVDYLVVGVEHTPEAEKAVDRATAKFESLRDRNRVGVVFTRVSAENAEDLPDQTEDAHLPVLGYWPADYRLATADEFSASGPQQAQPHQPYLSAIARLASLLIRLAPLTR